MKKFIPTMLILFLTVTVSGQDVSEEENVKQAVETFFEGFHARDSVIMKSVLAEGIVVQTVGKTQSGETRLHQEDIHTVLKGIVSIPLETEFEEVIHSYEIKIDGNMANAWTPYSFHVNGKFSHCGVNNFQLLKKDQNWEIIYLIDTRRREGCKESSVN